MIDRLSARFRGLTLLWINCCVAAWIALNKLMVLLERYDEAPFGSTARLVPAWPAEIRAFASIELFVAVVMASAALLTWRGRRGAKYVLLACIAFFLFVSSREIVSFIREIGVDRLPFEMVALSLAWLVWLVLNYWLFHPAADTRK